jgi:hypothetical protein
MSNLIIPLNNDNNIVSLEEMKQWALIKFENGKNYNIEYYTDKNEIEDYIDCVIVKSQNEYVWPFMEENIAVLVAPYQETLDEVIEAFIFKELHDLNIA